MKETVIIIVCLVFGVSLFTGLFFATSYGFDEVSVSTNSLKWERISYVGQNKTYRTPIYGGWLVAGTQCMVFVPDPDHNWIIR